MPLQTGNCINERRLHPWLNGSLRMRRSDDVSSRLFHDAEPVEFQLADNRRLSRARDDKPSHEDSLRKP